MMGSGAVSHVDLMENRNRFYESLKAYILANEKEEDSRSYPPLSFYTDSTVSNPGPMWKGKSVTKNFIPLSLYTTTATVYHPAPMCKGNKSSESNIMIPLREVNNSSESKVSRNSIPDQVALSILSKLPVKSLKRFGCVRKSWSNLFENPDFMTMYANHFISHHGHSHDYHTFLLINQFYRPDSPHWFYLYEFHLLNNKLKFNLPSPFPHSGSHISILCSTSVNGIFCLGQNHREKVQYVLWNPATKEFMVIPSSPAELIPKRPQSNLYLQHFFHGFGYDQRRHDFKLIQYVSSYDCDDPDPFPAKSFFEIYSLKSNSWRMIDMDDDLSYWTYSPSFTGLELYLHGACHWLVYKSINDDDQLIGLSLLSFDLSDELFFTTPIGEESYTPYTFQAHLALLNGSIALISNYHDDTVFHISILGQLGVSESWIKLYVSGPFPSLEWPPAGFGKTGCIFFTKKDSTKKSDQLAYLDLSTQIVQEVGITLGEGSHFITGLYKESLLPIGESTP